MISQNANGTSSSFYVDFSLQSVVIHLMALACVFIVLGNLFIIFSIFRFERLKQNISNYFIASLASCDFLTGLFVVPMAIYQKKYLKMEASAFFCDILQGTHMVTGCATLLHILAISLDRFYRIKEPLKYKAFMTSRKALSSSAFMWMSSLISMLICFKVRNFYERVYSLDAPFFKAIPAAPLS